jgi:glutathione S-transferase
MTIADLDIYGVVAFAGEAEIDLAPYAQVTDWMKRIEALPGFKPPKDLLPMESRVAA